MTKKSSNYIRRHPKLIQSILMNFYKMHGKFILWNDFMSVEVLLRNRSSFLYGRKPGGTVPVYAVIKNCIVPDVSTDVISLKTARDERKSRRKGDETLIASRNVQIDDFGSSMILTNDLPGKIWKGDGKQSLEVHMLNRNSYTVIAITEREVEMLKERHKKKVSVL